MDYVIYCRNKHTGEAQPLIGFDGAALRYQERDAREELRGLTAVSDDRLPVTFEMHPSTEAVR